MKLCKVFDYQEIEQDLNIDFLEFLSDNDWNFSNDIAISWWIAVEEHEGWRKQIDEYFISQGCKEDEEVYIWISW